MENTECVHNHFIPIEQYIEDVNGKKAILMPMHSCSISVPPYLLKKNVLFGLREILIGIGSLHACGIVHNNIKPSPATYSWTFTMDTSGSTLGTYAIWLWLVNNERDPTITEMVTPPCTFHAISVHEGKKDLTYYWR